MHKIKEKISAEYVFFTSLVLAILLTVISPNLIAIICVLPLLLYILINVNKLSLNYFDNGIFIFIVVGVFLSATNYIFNDTNNETLYDLAKTLFLVSAVLFSYNLLKKENVNISSKKQKTLCIIALISLFLCLYQMLGNFLIKNFLEQKTSLPVINFQITNSFINGLTILIWPSVFIAITRRFKIVCLLSLFVLILLLILGKTNAAIVSFILAIIVFFSFYLFKNKFKYILKIGMLFLVIIFFTVPSFIVHNKDEDYFASHIKTINDISPSALHRLDIWDRSLKLIKEKPYMGWGTSNSDILPKSNETVFFNHQISRDIFDYPHNIFLQITLELGFVGLVWLVLFINYIINCISRLNAKIQPYAYAMFAATIGIWIFGIPLYRSWWLVYLSLLSALMKILSDNLESS